MSKREKGLIDSQKTIFIKLLGSKGTVNILLHLDEHGAAQNKEFDFLISRSTLNERLCQLLKFGLITHHLTRKDVRKEWYEITEKGRKTVKHLKRLAEISVLPEEGKKDE